MFKSPLLFVFIAIGCFTLVAFDNAEGKGSGSKSKSKPPKSDVKVKPPKSDVKVKPPSTVTAKPIGLTTKGVVGGFVDTLKEKAKDHIAKEAVEKITEKGQEYVDKIKDKFKGDDVEAAGDKSTEKDEKIGKDNINDKSTEKDKQIGKDNKSEIINNQPTTQQPTLSPELFRRAMLHVSYNGLKIKWCFPRVCHPHSPLDLSTPRESYLTRKAEVEENGYRFKEILERELFMLKNNKPVNPNITKFLNKFRNF
ncbi:hypothetical protein TKK_0000849 [Trichogramma kaykai]|uniref:Uncharacterized protein n=1 Tax=Trichogramma kaykai TaxID=54128 RepID=A0ABD2VW19_9HYME